MRAWITSRIVIWECKTIWDFGFCSSPNSVRDTISQKRIKQWKIDPWIRVGLSKKRSGIGAILTGQRKKYRAGGAKLGAALAEAVFTLWAQSPCQASEPRCLPHRGLGSRCVRHRRSLTPSAYLPDHIATYEKFTAGFHGWQISSKAR